ncbi:MAG: hypothetical protein BGN99_03465 [Alphaproteobacteria bacterium 65-37]|nr:hypothetical protein [Alphaproteobacteria bacterium]OJU32003.1 MAG: hypothetical protein BGN99_03465 [Alphaproteobacteria bacterium 65-37]
MTDNNNNTAGRPLGRRFSHVYMDRAVGLTDSPRLRRRISAEFEAVLRPSETSDQYRLKSYLERKTGETVPVVGDWHYLHFRQFLETSPLDTFLDSITLLAQFHPSNSNVSQAWITACSSIFREEQTAYSLDDAGGVHLHVDKAFQTDRALAVEALRGPRYEAAADLLAQAYIHLNGSRPSPRDAFKNAFDAVETLFKLMTGEARVGDREALKNVSPMLNARYKADETAKTASQLLLKGFIDWVAAAHQYRHGPSEDGAAEPPPEVWQHLLSQAASHIRWLSDLDRWNLGAAV